MGPDYIVIARCTNEGGILASLQIGGFCANAAGVIAVVVVVNKIEDKIIVNANVIASAFCFFLSVLTDISSLLLGFITFYKLPLILKTSHSTSLFVIKSSLVCCVNLSKIYV